MASVRSQIVLSRAAAACALAVQIVAAAPARAQGGAPPVAWTDLLRQGVDLFRAQRYEEARAALATAYELRPCSEALVSLALAEFQSRHVLDAAYHMRRYLESAGLPPDKAEAIGSKWLPRAEAQIGRVAVDAPPGRRVLADGSARGDTPLREPLDLLPGDHEISVGAEAKHVHVRAGELATLRFDAPRETVALALPPALSPDRTTQSVPTSRAGVPPTTKIVTIGALGTAAILAAGAGLLFGLVAKDEPGSASGQDRSRSMAFCFGGAVLAGAAVTTWFLWPERPSTRFAWSFRPQWDAHVRGAWIAAAF
jgi:hypothetical protein